MGVSITLFVELWGLVHRLKLARSLHINKLIVELDSKVVVNMIIMKQSHRVIVFILSPSLRKLFG